MPAKDSSKTKTTAKGLVSNDWTDMRPLDLESEPESKSTTPDAGKTPAGKPSPSKKT